MRRKLLSLAIVTAALLANSAATARPNDPNDPCFLHAGCYWDTIAMKWQCADPGVYAMCAPD